MERAKPVRAQDRPFQFGENCVQLPRGEVRPRFSGPAGVLIRGCCGPREHGAIDHVHETSETGRGPTESQMQFKRLCGPAAFQRRRRQTETAAAGGPAGPFRRNRTARRTFLVEQWNTHEMSGKSMACLFHPCSGPRP